jgi:hypothetical protein
MLILSAVRKRCSRLLWHDENFESADEGKVAAVKDEGDIAAALSDWLLETGMSISKPNSNSQSI